MTSTHQPSRHTLNNLDDIVRFAMSEFLSPLERVMFVSSMAPLNDASNNQHISYLSKQLLEDEASKGGLTLDMNLLDDDVLARMTDVDIYRILKHVSSFVNTFRLGNCINVHGWGLAPLKHMSKIAIGECQLQEKMTLPILHSIINTFGNKLLVVQFPVDWRAKGKENKLLHRFLLAFDEKLCYRHMYCYGCAYCIDSDESGIYAMEIELKYFGEGKDTYGLQQYVCYECSDVTCNEDDCSLHTCKVCQTSACQEKCSQMRWCDHCEKRFCVQCKDVRRCRECSNELCSDCCEEYVCDRCDSMDCCEMPDHCESCNERKCCVESVYCDHCDEVYCVECTSAMRCHECGRESCGNCLKVAKCFDYNEATCQYCGVFCDICKQWHCAFHNSASRCDGCNLVSCGRCAQVDYCWNCFSGSCKSCGVFNFCEHCRDTHCVCKPIISCDNCGKSSCRVSLCSECEISSCQSCGYFDDCQECGEPHCSKCLLKLSTGCI
ncbi:hypothetical protein CTEN210_10172 [Chaetoceros tenuissimus]|uniref:Uncharacterized protein n=1 Tax=Chaetoceros tenuissimus TaxID=426638 RepID=A0AAD3CWU9_9STRA|nr:hypothetical protein CTEN210_10172 [Chaetoceros tenuissimus]